MAEAKGQVRGPSEALLDALPDAVLVLSARGLILEANRAASQLFEPRSAGLVGMALVDLLETDAAASLMGLLMSGFVGTGAWDLRLADGRHFSLNVGRPGDGRILLVLRDVEHCHHVEEALNRARREASLGRLASVLAQEIQGPLSVIQGRLDLLSSTPEGKRPAVERQLRIVQEHAGRIATLVRNLQTFGNRPPLSRGAHPVQTLLERALQASGRRLDRVELVVSIQPTDLSVSADSELVPQLIANLLRRAADRSPLGRSISFEAKAVEGGVLLMISDDAEGLPDGLLQEIRSPYDGDPKGLLDPGLGLDLAIAWGIAQDHGGWLRAENLPGRGLGVEVYLPDPQPEPNLGRSRLADILVVDDDTLLCETVSWMLRGEGHRITTTGSAEEALERLRRSSYDLILTDIRLPGMDGEAFADLVEVQWPELAPRVVITSGLLRAPRRTNPYLQKPFSRSQLLEVLRRVLGQRSVDTGH